MSDEVAFEKFKFGIGDLVRHRSDSISDCVSGVVTQRALIQTVSGVHKEYTVSFLASEVAVQEIEIVEWIRPIRV